MDVGLFCALLAGLACLWRSFGFFVLWAASVLGLGEGERCLPSTGGCIRLVRGMEVRVLVYCKYVCSTSSGHSFDMLYF